jgi:TrpR-related protein YerC/YecD
MKSNAQSRRAALYKALSALKGPEEMCLFLADICTPKEIDQLAERWEIAKLLDEGKLSYRDIAAQTGASTTTVARVNRFLNQEPHQGYRIALQKLARQQSFSSDH